VHDASQTTTHNEDDYRLPRTVLPRRYELRMEPDLEAATFAGEVAIAVEVVTPTAAVVLNAKELEIEEAWLTVAGARVLGIAAARRRAVESS